MTRAARQIARSCTQLGRSHGPAWLVALALGVLAACGGSRAAQRFDALMATGGEVEDVSLEGPVSEACRLRDGMAYFGYDEAALNQLTPVVVARIAECMTAGRLVGRSILVPRADVAELLHQHGVPPSRVFVRQPDEADAAASGDDHTRREAQVIRP